MSIKEEIRDIIVLKDDPKWQELDAVWKGAAAMFQISQAACAILGKLNPDSIDEAAPEFVEAAEDLFDEYFVPIDLPVLGPVAEGWAEALLRRGIGTFIYNFIERLDRGEP